MIGRMGTPSPTPAGKSPDASSGYFGYPALALTIGVYLIAPISTVLATAAVALMATYAILLVWRGKGFLGASAGAIAGLLLPTAIRYPTATPALGALLVVVVLLANGRTDVWLLRLSRKAVAASAVTLLVVMTFSALADRIAESGRRGLSWGAPTAPDNLLMAILLVLAASTVNAIYEESYWRVFLLDLMPDRLPLWAWVLATNLGFGLVHLYGTPGGWVGVGATFLFGLAMTAVRRLSGGSLVLCIVTHVAADVILLGGLYVW